VEVTNTEAEEVRKTKGRVEEKGVSLTELIFRTGSGLVLTSYFISYFYFYFYFYFILFYLKGHVITAWSLLANFDWSSRRHHHYPATSLTCYFLFLFLFLFKRSRDYGLVTAGRFRLEFKTASPLPRHVTHLL